MTSPDSRVVTFPVTLHTMDSYQLGPDLLKIDAEGAEMLVLHGSARTLENTKRVIVEVHDQLQTEPVLPKVKSLLSHYGFSLKTVSIPNHPSPFHVIGTRSFPTDS